jgi:hypothetical protein
MAIQAKVVHKYYNLSLSYPEATIVTTTSTTQAPRDETEGRMPSHNYKQACSTLTSNQIDSCHANKMPRLTQQSTIVRTIFSLSKGLLTTSGHQ